MVMAVRTDLGLMHYVMADPAVNAVVEASTNGGVATRESYVMAITAALAAADEYTKKRGDWRGRMQQNFNSANDEEIAR